VLVAMEIFGLHEYIRDVTRRLAKLGAFAVAPDYYFRKGDLTKVTDVPQLVPLVNSKPDAELLSDLDSTGPNHRVAIPAGSASSDSAAADGRSGNIPPTLARSRRAPRFMARRSIRRIRSGRRARPNLSPR